MKIQKMIQFVFCVLAGLLLSACTTIRELPAEQLKAQGGQTPDHLLCRELLTAFLKNDAEKFVNLLPENLREGFDAEKFTAYRKSVLKSAGEPISFQYVTKLELIAFTPHIWKVRFKRTDLRTEKEYTSEVLFRVIVGWVDGKPIITAFNFL